MRPLLRWSLAATLLAVAGSALWPDAPALQVPAVQAPARAAAPGSSRDAVADPLRIASSTAGMTPSAAPGLPSRSPWPAPDSAGLAAWRGLPALSPALGPPSRPAAAPPVDGSAPGAGTEPAAAASAPSFPYPWLGQIDIDGRRQVFLGGASPLRVVAVGEVVDQRWRVDRVSAAGLHLTWLPTAESVLVPAR